MSTMKWRCPECGSTDLRVVVETWATLIQEEDNFQTEIVDGDHDWYGESFMLCNRCEHCSKADGFAGVDQAPNPIPGVILLNNLDDGVIENLFALPSPEMDEAIRLEAARQIEDEFRRANEYDALMQEIYESLEEINFPKEGEVDGVKVKLFGLGGAWHVMVLNSPCTTSASACSPCVPGAADLDSRHDDGLLCYDVPSSWRRKESQEN